MQPLGEIRLHMCVFAAARPVDNPSAERLRITAVRHNLLMGEFDMPFKGTAAVREGRLTRHGLTRFRRLHRDVYVSADTAITAAIRARAAALWAHPNCVLAGLSAAALHGSRWIDPGTPATIIRSGPRRSIPGVVVRTESLRPDEVTQIHGIPTTTVARTAFDLCRWLALDDAVAAVDALCNATRLDPAMVLELADRHRGSRRLRQLRQVISLVDGGAASPPETRTRLLIVRAGLPTPSTQVKIRDETGYPVAVSDLGWERWRVVVEYDGIHHWRDERQRTWDIDRYQILDELGWECVRVNSHLLREQPTLVLSRIRMKLAKAGAPV